MESQQDRILIVDDDPLNVRVLVEFLRGDYSLTIARDGPQTLERLQAGPLPDLVLLDVMMPGMDGYEVCRRIKSDPSTRALPVIFVTALNQPFDESAAFDAGGVDFLTKPIAPAVLQSRVRTHMRLRRSERLLMRQNAALDEQVRERTRELSQIQAVAIDALTFLSGQRTAGGAAHLRRTQLCVLALAKAARRQAAFSEAIHDSFLEALFRVSPLHDIGKIGLPDAAQNEDPAGDPERVRAYRSHPSIGRQAIQAPATDQGGEIEFLRLAGELIGTHHECWDGSGFPDGLRGEQIPLAGRLMAIADAYDVALVAGGTEAVEVRHAQAMDALRAGAGTRFDPRLVEAALQAAEEFLAAAQHHPDLPA